MGLWGGLSWPPSFRRRRSPPYKNSLRFAGRRGYSSAIGLTEKARWVQPFRHELSRSLCGPGLLPDAPDRWADGCLSWRAVSSRHVWWVLLLREAFDAGEGLDSICRRT